MIRHVRRIVMFAPPPRSADTLNALADQFAAAPAGKVLVYAICKHGSVPPALRDAAFQMAQKAGCALVQWPNATAEDPARTWCFGLQKGGQQ